MRILRLTQRLPPLPGGLEVHVRELSLAQAARGAQVEILFAEGDPVNEEGVTSHRLAPLGERHPLARRWSSQQRLGAAVSRVSRCAFGVPQIVHAHGDYALAAAALRLARRFGCPVVLTVHGGLSERPWHRALSRAVFPKLAHAIAVSPDVAGQLHARGLPESRITVLPSGLHRSRFHPLLPEQRGVIRTRCGVGEGEVLAVAVGRLHPVKGYRHLIEALRLLEQPSPGEDALRVPTPAGHQNAEEPLLDPVPAQAGTPQGEESDGDSSPCESRYTTTPLHRHPEPPRIRLVLVGDGPQGPALHAAARGLRSITFTGALPPAEVAQLLGSADLFVHPAVELGTQREGTPTSVLEALAAGLPVIATTTGGLPALLCDGEHGRLVPPANSAALAAAMQALAADRALRVAQSARNRRHPACRDWDEVAGRLLELYAALLPAGTPASPSAASEAAW